MTNKTGGTPEEIEAMRVSRDGVKALVKVTLPLWAAVVIGCVGALVLGIWQQDQRDDDQRAARVASCRNRNSAQEMARIDNLAILNGLREPFPDPDTQALIDALVRSQSRPEEVDSDCDGDGWLTADDYAIPKPTVLPIQLPPIREEATS